MNKVLSTLIGRFLLSSSIASASEELAGLDYWNKIKKDAIQTDLGLQYKALIMGDGRKPTAKSRVIVHYCGRLLILTS